MVNVMGNNTLVLDTMVVIVCTDALGLTRCSVSVTVILGPYSVNCLPRLASLAVEEHMEAQVQGVGEQVEVYKVE